jgi:transposase
VSGRPTKLTPEVQKRIIDALRAGNYVETAAAYAGIGRQTLYDWLHRGAKEGKGAYHEFHEAVEKALAESEVRDVALIAKAAEAQWQAAAWRLERRAPERWGKRVTVDDQQKQSLRIKWPDAADEADTEPDPNP